MYFWPCKTAGERWAVGGWQVTGAHGCPSLLPGAVPGCPLMLRHLLCPEQLWKRICPVPAPLSTSGCSGRVPTLPPAGRPSLVPPPTPSLSPLGKENCSYVFRPNARSLQTPLEVWDRKPGVLQVSGGPPGRARGGVCCLSPGVGARCPLQRPLQVPRGRALAVAGSGTPPALVESPPTKSAETPWENL